MESSLSRYDYEEFLIYALFPAGRNYLSRCIACAYRDLRRTVHGFRTFKEREKTREEADIYLYDLFVNLRDTELANQAAFDQWHRQACLMLASIYQQNGFEPFYVGQAQKWLNMTFKYVYTVGERRMPGYTRLYSFCHAPLDRDVIEALRKHGFTLKPERWSRIESYEKYLSYQQWIREHFSENPLDLEFRLWLESQKNKPLS